MDAVSVGVPVVTACVLAGVSERTFYDWQSKGRRDETAGRNTKWARFAQGVSRARAQAEGALVAELRTLATQDARILLSMLARMYPASWGRPGQRMDRETEAAYNRAKIRQLEAEAKLTEARATVLIKAAEGGGSTLLLPQDLLGDMNEDLRVMFVAYLRGRGLSVMSPPALGAGVTRADVEAASPSPLTIDAQPMEPKGDDNADREPT